jgi:hypothetical protein
MDSNVVVAMAGVLGSLVGGSASIATNWVVQKTRSRRELLRAEMSKREALYGEFISECSKRAIDSFARSLEKPETLLTMYKLLNRIRLCASDAVLQEAQRAVGVITEQYFGSNLSLEEMRELFHRGEEADPLRPFAEACRCELKAMLASA